MTPEEIQNIASTIAQSGNAADVLLELSATLSHDARVMKNMAISEMEEDGITDKTSYEEDYALAEKLEAASNHLYEASLLIGSLDD